MFKSISFFAILTGCTVMVAANANEAEKPAADPAAFAQKLAACGACHGEKGNKPLAPDYPMLAGQHADYIAAALRHYRDGRRTNPIMSAQVQALKLSEDDIKGLAEYFSQQESPLKALHN